MTAVYSRGIRENGKGDREMDQYTAEATEQKLYEDMKWAEQHGGRRMQETTRRAYDKHLAKTKR
jgi:hypothetical protein